MKKISLISFLIFAAATFSNITAQEPPGNTGDVDLRDNDIRLRSVELERIKREANKSAVSSAGLTASVNTDIDKKYPQIKEDFEGIQNNQSAIIKTYTTGEKINYKQIKLLAEEIKKNSKRLDENLFVAKAEVKKEESAEKDEKVKGVKELIVYLDNAVGDFVSSPMFQNLRVVDSAVAGKAQFNLAKIIELSDLLAKEAGKMK
jgi:hypothetical protein